MSHDLLFSSVEWMTWTKGVRKRHAQSACDAPVGMTLPTAVHSSTVLQAGPH